MKRHKSGRLQRRNDGNYIVNININGAHSGYCGIGKTPTKTKADARRKSKKLVRK